MKKIISILLVFVLLGGLVSAQVLSKDGVQNTVSTSLGVPYGDIDNPGREGFHFYGLIDTLQIRKDYFDILQIRRVFTLEGMLNWGMLTNWKYDFGSPTSVDDDRWTIDGLTFSNTRLTPFSYTNDWLYGAEQANGSAERYYVNMLYYPTRNIDIGMGTRLDWMIGPAPNHSGNLWEPTAHIVQGGLKNGTPGSADVVGYIRYANCYARTALAGRFRNDIVEVGVSIPSGATTDYFLTNFAFGIRPVNWIYIGAAFEGIWKGDSNLYTGMKIDIKDFFVLDTYLAIDNIGGNNGNGMYGTGAAVTIKVPKIDLTVKPEVGLTFWENKNYSLACYAGVRATMDVQRFNIDLWTSFASGASDKTLGNNYTGGFVFDIRPNVSFKVDGKNTISAMFDYQYRRSFDNKRYDAWATSVYWTFRM